MKIDFPLRDMAYLPENKIYLSLSLPDVRYDGKIFLRKIRFVVYFQVQSIQSVFSSMTLIVT